MIKYKYFMLHYLEVCPYKIIVSIGKQQQKKEKKHELPIISYTICEL